ncbi:DUF6647 family protein [Roseovarius salis]|uniref:DUF6647 family protein n=1 Tax=Roseovarius salis TaxID=3376063 RepID=UPI0037C7736F
MRTAILFALLLLAPASAAARPAGDCPAPDMPPRALVESLIRWIGAETGYDMASALARPPGIRFCRTGEMIEYDGAGWFVDPALRAAYDLKTRTVYLVLPWDADDAFDRSVLLHELVHHVQLANRDWPCPGAPEWQAYKLQDRWLRARGIEHGFDWLRIWFMSRCPRDIHPDCPAPWTAARRHG